MVVMSTRQTSVNFINNSKVYNTSIIGIKGDSVVAEAKDVMLDIATSEKLGGALTMQDAIVQLNDTANVNNTTINANLEEIQSQVTNNKIAATKESKVAALIF